MIERELEALLFLAPDPVPVDELADALRVEEDEVVAGLRALYFVLDGMTQRFDYPHYGLGALLVFVGVKMLAEDLIGQLPVGISLGVIVTTLGAAVGASLLFSRRRETSAA